MSCVLPPPPPLMLCRIRLKIYADAKSREKGGVVSSCIKDFLSLPILICRTITTTKVFWLLVSKHQKCNQTDTINYHSFTPKVGTYDTTVNLYVEIKIDAKQAYWRCYIAPQKSDKALLSPHYILFSGMTRFIF